MNIIRFVRWLPTLVLVLFLVPQRALSQTDCGQILEHGVFNVTSTDSLQIKTKTFINWLSQSSFDSYQKAVDTGGALGIPIEGIPIQVSGFFKASDWHNYQASLQKLDFSDEKNLDAFKQVVIAADQGIVAAWTTCVLNKKGEAHAAIEVNYDPKQFVVRLNYTPNGPPPSDKISDFTIVPATVVCKPSIYTYWFWHTYIESQGMILNCTRQSDSDAIQITGNTEKGAITAKLGGIVPPPTVVAPKVDPVTELSGTCAKNTFPPPRGDAIPNGYNIGDQEVWHIKCPVKGTVTSATYVSCVYSNNSPCSHINARPELTGPCPDDPKAACITFQTNDGNFKVVKGTYTYTPDPPDKK
jgi:hypothetical protein